MKVIAVSVFLLFCGTTAFVWECKLPQILAECYKFYTHGLNPTQIPAHAIQSQCIDSYLRKTAFSRYFYNITQDGINYLSSLQREMRAKKFYYRKKRQAIRPAERREIRTLSDGERQNFITAINTLKQRGEYDIIANQHQGIVLQTGHGGPNFLSWHREYLSIYEMALQRINPSVMLPYWDSTLDFDMEEPSESVMFSSQLMGNGDGIVTTGPFADWPPRPDGARLQRNIAATGSLMTKEGVDLFINNPNFNRTIHIVIGGDATLADTLEGQHNNVHNWVGSTMSERDTAAHDPLFFLHHGYIDYLWERFREKMVALGTANPETDYPITNISGHEPGLRMDGFSDVNNIDGYSNRYTRELYSYANAPECGDNCGGSRFLRCDTNLNRCISLTATEVGDSVRGRLPPSPTDLNSFQFLNSFIDPRTRFARSVDHVRRKRDVSINHLLENSRQKMSKMLISKYNQNHMVAGSLGKTQKKERNKYLHMMDNLSVQEKATKSIPVLERGIQNSFSVDGESDTTKWAFIPVKIVHERSTFESFGSYFILNGKRIPYIDLYNPKIYKNLKPFIHEGNPAVYQKCKKVDSGVAKVYVRSDGFNYKGTYIDHAIIDERQPMAEVTAYVAVRNPKCGAGKAYITVYDSAGRVCEANCLVQGSFPPVYKPCSGVINISQHAPKMYGDDYGEAVRSQWNFGLDCPPSSALANVFLTFYCRAYTQWPWKNCLMY